MGPPTQRYPTRARNPSVRLKDFWSLLSEVMEEPISFKVANGQKDWRKAIENEVQSILKNKTWDVIDRPNDKNPITAKWIFKAKKNAKGTVNKLKAHIVA